MNLESLNEQELLKLTKRYFYYGIPILPFFWLVNFVWIYPFVQKRNPNNQNEIEKYLKLSLAGSIFWLVALITWTSIYTSQRENWNITDNLAVYLQKG